MFSFFFSYLFSLINSHLCMYKGKIASLTSGLERVSSTSEEAEAVVAAGKIAEERCCSLSAKVTTSRTCISKSMRIKG